MNAVRTYKGDKSIKDFMIRNFDKIDKDQSGEIDPEECKDILHSICIQIYRQADQDEDATFNLEVKDLVLQKLVQCQEYLESQYGG